MGRKPFLNKYHLVATPEQIDLLNYFNMKPVVLVRNIYDVILSMTELLKNASRNHGGIILPPDYNEWNLERQLDFTTDGLADWFISIYCSWVDAREQGLIEAQILTYEAMIDDPIRHFQTIGRLWDQEWSVDAIKRAMAQVGKSQNFNVGIQGRGMRSMTPRQIEHVNRIAAYYSQYDLSLLGIDQGQDD